MDEVDNCLYAFPTVHSTPGGNFKVENAYTANREIKDCLLCGHFGEVMSHRDKIITWPNLKFILISPDTFQDRQLLHQRWQKLGKPYWTFQLGSYFDGEQVFLYEPFMFRDCFKVDMSAIMNISISEWFVEDITMILDRLSKFLNRDFDVMKCLDLHKRWYKHNFGSST